MPTKLREPIVVRDTRNDVLEISSLNTLKPSAIIVPAPTEVRNGFVAATSLPKFDPVCRTGFSRQPTHFKKWTMKELSPNSSGKKRVRESPPITR